MLVRTGRPGVPWWVASRTTGAPVESTTLTSVVGVPASRRSQIASSPRSPTIEVALYGGPSAFSWAAVIGPTAPTSWSDELLA